jgi:molybdate transport system regulatory protein
MHRGEIAFGPGKAELLAAIQSLGSIAKAASSMGMSYMRAWTLVKIVNASFREPLVELDRGGVGGGSARITPAGKKVLDLYHAMIAKSEAATRGQWGQLRELLRTP